MYVCVCVCVCEDCSERSKPLLEVSENQDNFSLFFSIVIFSALSSMHLIQRYTSIALPSWGASEFSKTISTVHITLSLVQNVDCKDLSFRHKKKSDCTKTTLPTQGVVYFGEGINGWRSRNAQLFYRIERFDIR